MKYFVSLIAIAAIFASALVADHHMTAKVGEMAPNFTLTSAAGNEHSLADFKGKYVVLEWTNFGCPFVRKHYDVKNMQNLQKEYTVKDVVWLSICSSAMGKQGYFEGDDLTKQLKEEGTNATAYLIDADGKVGHMYGAKITPHMFIINPEGKLVYAGAIDSKKSTNSEDIANSTNYVKTSLDELMAGKEVSNPTTKPYGCSIKYAKK